MSTLLLKSMLLILAIMATGTALYCQPDNCYQLLEVSQSASQEQIKKAFRLMARRLHPDRNQLQDTTQIFQKINLAYEVLDNEHTRQAYDAFLSDPSGFRGYHTYQFYRASYSPQINPFFVLFSLLALLSWLQWVMRKQMYQSAFDRIIQSEDFRIKVNEQCINQGKKGDKRFKQQVAEKLQQEICIEGGYSQPKPIDLLIFQFLLLPYSFLKFLWDWARWIGKYYILRREYQTSDQQYLTKKILKIPIAKWQHMPEQQRTKLLERKLWVKSNMAAYREQMQQQQLEIIKQTNPAKYRKIMTYLKKTQ